jgi:beta-1,4-N-acetylglucosaminyltransferase
MKIALVCSHGGHLTEMFALMEAFSGEEIVLVTYESPRTRHLPHRTYLMPNIGTSPRRMLAALQRFVAIYRKERPELIISTGSEIAIPAFYSAKLMGIPTIFVESWCRVRTTSLSGRLVYPVADQFLVQWPELERLYGRKARYVGAVI